MFESHKVRYDKLYGLKLAFHLFTVSLFVVTGSYLASDEPSLDAKYKKQEFFLICI